MTARKTACQIIRDYLVRDGGEMAADVGIAGSHIAAIESGLSGNAETPGMAGPLYGLTRTRRAP